MRLGEFVFLPSPMFPMVYDLLLPYSIEFYTTFWSLTMYDLKVPKAAYEKQIQSLKAQIAAIEDNKDQVSPLNPRCLTCKR